jgi:hypothetical protein
MAAPTTMKVENRLERITAAGEQNGKRRSGLPRRRRNQDLRESDELGVEPQIRNRQPDKREGQTEGAVHEMAQRHGSHCACHCHSADYGKRYRHFNFGSDRSAASRIRSTFED